MAITPSELLLIIKAKDEVSKVIDEVTKNTKGLDKTFGAVGKGLATVGGVALGAAGAGIAAAAGVLATSIGPASDLAETVSKVGVVFGEQADEMMAFAETAVTAMGMTSNQALAAAATYGNLFRSMGMAEDTSADMSSGLVQLAADLASFNNIDPSVALDKLRAGLSGETEPLKTLGVNINQALLEAKALEMGLWDGEGALNAAAKAQASYALIMEQTSLAQGDFARTSEGLANQQRITAATMGEIQATIGTALLPAITALQSTINKIAADPRFQEFLAKAVEAIGAFAVKVVESIPKVIETFETVSAWLSENEGVVVAALAALGVAVATFVYTTVIPAAAAMIAALAPIVLPIAAIGAAVYLLYEAWANDWGGIRTALTAAWTQIKPIFEKIKEWLGVNIPKALDALTTAFNWVKDNVLAPVAGAFDKIGEAIGKVLGFIGSFGDKWEGIKDKLPDWAVPGSPTPLELGLLGIADALRIVERAQASAFSALETTRGGEGVTNAIGGMPTGSGLWSNPGGIHGLPDSMLDLSAMPDLVEAWTNAIIVEVNRRRRAGENEEGLRATAPVRDIHLTIYTQTGNVPDIQIGVQNGLHAAGVWY